MIQRICMIVNTNAYETKRYYAKCFSKALERAGISVSLLDMTGQNFEMEHFRHIQDFNPQLTCSFNSILALSSGKFLWDYTKIPHWLINLDPVLYSLDLTQSPYSILSCVDRWEEQWLREQQSFEKTLFFPHATDSQLSFDPKADRPLDVVMIGSCYDHEVVKKRWPLSFDLEECAIMEEAVERVLKDHRLHFIQALDEGFQERKKTYPQERFRELCFCVDYYLRGKDRYELIRSLTDSEVHIFGGVHRDTFEEGRGWESYLGSLPHVTLHEPISFEKSLEVLSQSKISLNSVPSFKDGTHIRLFTGPMLGSLVLTNDNAYIREFFHPGEDILSYRYGEWESLRGSIAKVLSNEAKRREMVEAARLKILEAHTWDQRVQSLEVLESLL